MPAPSIVKELVDRFSRNREAYQSAGYNETQLRREFLDPFFKALGWDIDNEAGRPEAYKDVIHEDAIKIGGTTKAPDYCFRIGGRRIFFLEAKKPAVNVKTDDNPAFQLRRYAWSAKLPLSILSDFEELAVYDCRLKPDQGDKASIGRLLFLTFEQYVEKWDELAGIFSKEAVQKGSFDKYAESIRRKRGTAEVDAAFLAEIESWRGMLARNFALRNEDLSQRDLNYAVQRTIDRIIFLRMCEDRGVEPYAQLMGLINGEQVYARLRKLFRDADDRYNSGLFHFHKEKDRAEPPDELTPSLKLDDKPLKEIIRGLYYPESPYEFSVLPAEILGQVYEQFLGKVIRLTPAHKAIVEAKPEVKKAGGVYYTPSYIVDYIVEQTIGKLVDGKTPKQVAKIRVLDPACGSGSFLVGAYQFLLNWHRDWYIADGPKAHTKEIYRGQGGQWFLATGEKKRILLNNVFGVDIDSQAVEVTKLSLLLKVLENENRDSLDRQLRLLHERALPDLGENIKCGNSLIGPDFYQGKQTSMLDDEEYYHINAFDWKKEFPEVFQKSQGGFDAVIGNPPYIDSEWMTSFLPTTRSYCVGRYHSASGNWDIFCVFAERALQLCRPGAIHSFIVPNKLGSAGYAAGIRTVLTRDNRLDSIRDYSHVRVFPVAVYPIVYVVRKEKPNDKTGKVVCERMRLADEAVIESCGKRSLRYSQYFADAEMPWEVFTNGGGSKLVERLKRLPNLGTTSTVLGAATVSEAYEFKSFIVDARAPKPDDLRFVNSGTIDRYSNLWGQKPCRYLGETYLKPVIPRQHQRALPQTRCNQARSPKLIISGMTKRLEVIGDADGSVMAGKSTTIVIPEVGILFLLGLLNSELVNFFYNAVFGGNKLQGGYLRIGPPQVRQIPIPDKEQLTRSRIGRMDELVTKMLELCDVSRLPKAGHQSTIIQRQIAALDRQIDQLVYELYGLTNDEIALVEASAVGSATMDDETDSEDGD